MLNQTQTAFEASCGNLHHRHLTLSNQLKNITNTYLNKIEVMRKNTDKEGTKNVSICSKHHWPRCTYKYPDTDSNLSFKLNGMGWYGYVSQFFKPRHLICLETQQKCQDCRIEVSSGQTVQGCTCGYLWCTSITHNNPPSISPRTLTSPG